MGISPRRHQHNHHHLADQRAGATCSVKIWVAKTNKISRHYIHKLSPQVQTPIAPRRRKVKRSKTIFFLFSNRNNTIKHTTEVGVGLSIVLDTKCENMNLQATISKVWKLINFFVNLKYKFFKFYMAPAAIEYQKYIDSAVCTFLEKYTT